MAEHNTLTGTSLHEAKQISTAGTSDAGKVITPSASTAGTGTLRNLVESEINSKVAYLTVSLADVSTSSSVYVPLAYAGTITEIRSCIAGAIATANAAITCSINGTPITNGGLTIAFSGSAAGDVDVATPTALNTFTSGDYLSIATDGASTNTVVVHFMLTITRS